MGHLFLLGGLLMLGFVSTKTGMKYRWWAVGAYLVLFTITISYQVGQLNAKPFSYMVVAELRN